MASGTQRRRSGLIDRFTKFGEIVAELDFLKDRIQDELMSTSELRRVAGSQKKQILALEEKNVALQNHNIGLNRQVTMLKDHIQDFIFGPIVERKTFAELNGDHPVSDEVWDAAVETMLNRRQQAYQGFGVLGTDLPYPNPVNDFQRALNKLGLASPDQDQARGVYFALYPRHLFGEPSQKFVDRSIRDLMQEVSKPKVTPIRLLNGNDKLWHPKWKGYRIADVLFHDPAYLVWMHENQYINLELVVYREAQNRSKRT